MRYAFVLHRHAYPCYTATSLPGHANGGIYFGRISCPKEPGGCLSYMSGNSVMILVPSEHRL
jgi:hypothetical protein